jgi:hypothetical protein
MEKRLATKQKKNLKIQKYRGFKFLCKYKYIYIYLYNLNNVYLIVIVYI